MAASSTPIHISSRSSTTAAGSDSPTLTTRSLGGHHQQQSSSVPTSSSATAAAGSISNLQQTQLQAAAHNNSSNASMAASNLSLGVSTQIGSSGSGSGGGGGGGGGTPAAAANTITTSITPPNSAGLRSSTGIVNWASDSKYDGGSQTADKSSADTTKLNRKESYKAQRKNYRREKKRVASELMNSLQDPAVIVLADWLKVRGTLKSWTKLWCVLKPGLLLIYKSPKTKSSHWVGTVLLTSCQVIERPSKKDGVCFKVFHPMEQSIWAPRGPDKETIGAVIQPLPTAYLIFRAPSQAAGKCWMDALELSLRCSALLLRTNNNAASALQTSSYANDTGIQISHETQWSEADYEKHFNEQDLDGDSQNERAGLSGNDSDTDSEPHAVEQLPVEEEEPKETPYAPVQEGEIVTQAGETVEELAEEHKGLIWHLLKQVRPGMDLSKVVLPTFILEPRSFLDKLSDSYYHADLLSRAVHEDDPFNRMKTVVQWYLSGFYKKPKGLKKPYNPILGETFRCFWEHPNGSRTFYIAEQVSHHPPISAFYVTNRQDGFSISCSILAKSKFYGNSTSAVLEGVATLTLLPRGESYTLTTPYAHCKGILMGTLSMELGGKIQIECENTGYKTDLEFKLKPLFGNADSTNAIAGKIKLGKEVLATVHGHWDTQMFIKDTRTGDETVLFEASKEIKKKRLLRYCVPIEYQLPHESERLWHLVSQAIRSDDQVGATEEKTVLEEAQRNAAKDRKAALDEWQPILFKQDIISGQWLYKYADLRPWDPRNDLKQYECNYQVLTKTKLHAPIKPAAILLSDSRQKLLYNKAIEPISNDDSDETSHSADEEDAQVSRKSMRKVLKEMNQLHKVLDEHSLQLDSISNKLETMRAAVLQQQRQQKQRSDSACTSIMGLANKYIPESVSESTVIKSVILAFIGIFLYLTIKWLTK